VFLAFNGSEEEDQIARLSAWNNLLALWRRAPATSATNKEGSYKDRTQGDSTTREEWFRILRKITFAFQYYKKDSVQQTKQGERFYSRED